MTLPGVSERIDGRLVEIMGEKLHLFDSADVEIGVGAIRPDVLAGRSVVQLAIEIRVTHACPPEKRAFFEQRQLSALEIDLSELPRDAGPEVVADAVITSAPRTWIYNRTLADRRAKAIKRMQARQRRTAPRILYLPGPWGDDPSAADITY